MTPKKPARHFPDDGCVDPPAKTKPRPEDVAKMKQEIGILIGKIREKVGDSPKKVAVVVTEWLKRPAGSPAPKAPASPQKPKPPKAA